MNRLRYLLPLAVVALAMLPGSSHAATTERVSVDGSEIEGASNSSVPDMSDDARFVAFETLNAFSADINSLLDIYVRDRNLGSTTRISLDTTGADSNGTSNEPAVNGNGRFVAFSSTASDLVAGDGALRDIFLRDRDTDGDKIYDEAGAVSMVRISSDPGGGEGFGSSNNAAISTDAIWIAFDSTATDLVASDLNGFDDVFVRSRLTATTERISVDTAGGDANSHSDEPDVSADGHHIAFHSTATDLVPSDTATNDIFVRDRDLNNDGIFNDGVTLKITVDIAGGEANNQSFEPSISANGRFIAFHSVASDLVPADTNGTITDVFLYDRDTDADGVYDEAGLTSMAIASLDFNGSGSNGTSSDAFISPDGRYVSFQSNATDLVPGDTNNAVDAFVYDRVAGYIVRSSVATDGSEPLSVDTNAGAITNAGQVIFNTVASNLVADDTNGVRDVFFRGLDGDNDDILEPEDNCVSSSNADQTDTDNDGLGNPCDADDDDDSLPDTADLCPIGAEDHDGFQDADGCPEPDNDGDGICDPGAAGGNCIGSDFGANCFDPAATLSCTSHDCSNVAEDMDAFKDSDGCPEPDNDNDSFPDATDACPGTAASAGADGMFGAPQDANHNGVRDGAEAAFTTDDVMPLLMFEDKDGVLDTDGCHDSPGDDFDGDGLTDDSEVFTVLTDAGNPDTDADTVADGTDNCPLWLNTAQTLPSWTVPANDSDCDGFNRAREQHVGTDPTKHCNENSGFNNEPDAWPTDFNDSRLTDLSDVVLMGPTFNKLQNQQGYNQRFDLDASNSVLLGDVIAMGPFWLKFCN